MILWGILISAFLIGFSGAMMPGPMLGVTINGSLEKGWIAGPMVVLGHGILELVLIIVMALGLKNFFSDPIVAGFIGLFGGVFLAWMGYGMIKSSIKKTISVTGREKTKDKGIKNLTLAGALISAVNPYFIIWWSSVGMESIRQSYVRGLVGILFFFTGHILSDFTWYTIISTVFSKSKNFFNDVIYRRIVLLLGIFIIAFSIYFVNSGWNMLRVVKATNERALPSRSLNIKNI